MVLRLGRKKAVTVYSFPGFWSGNIGTWSDKVRENSISCYGNPGAAFTGDFKVTEMTAQRGCADSFQLIITSRRHCAQEKVSLAGGTV